MRIAAVANLSRPGVIHRGRRAPIQARNPVAAAPAVIAVAMHCMHMGRVYAQESIARGNFSAIVRMRPLVVIDEVP